jgi:hypothetical protein
VGRQYGLRHLGQAPEAAAAQLPAATAAWFDRASGALALLDAQRGCLAALDPASGALLGSACEQPAGGSGATLSPPPPLCPELLHGDGSGHVATGHTDGSLRVGAPPPPACLPG